MNGMPAGSDGRARVLIVDDERDIHEDFKDMLKPRVRSPSDDLASTFMVDEVTDLPLEFELMHASSGEEALGLVTRGARCRRPISVAYIDIRMPPGIDGVETIREIRKIDRDIEIVIMTAYTDKPLPEIVQDMEMLHKLLYIRKPFAREEVQQITLALVEKWKVEQELAERRKELTTSHRRLEAVLDAIGEAMAMYDDRERLSFANRWYEEIMGGSLSALQAMSPELLKERIKERVRGPLNAGDEEDGDEEDSVDRESGGIVEHVAGDGGRRLFHRSRKPVYDDSGEVIGSLYVYRDVSREIEIERMEAEVLRLRAELQTTYAFSKMIGSGMAMRGVYELMERVKQADVTVLVVGESGTGKEVVARALHDSGPRKSGPFIAVNCAAIPPTLIESELFGHERGAFTGATVQRAGCFERASGGTILLDEIGDMPPELQAKLLRVLQEREIQRVGGTTPIKVDARVIASTNRDLQGAMRAGEFRADLYYRLAAFPIVVPPLRERREDVPLLANHFLKKSAARNRKPVTGISAAALRKIMQHDWPGNVRELQSVVERAVLVEPSDVLQSSSLPSELAAEALPSTDGNGVLPLADLERRAILGAMRATDRNVSRAAKALGISRATLHRKLRRLSLHGAEGRSARTAPASDPGSGT